MRVEIPACSLLVASLCACSSENSPEPSASSPIVAETCNFQDDDGDGAIDEGFDYELGTWVNIGRTERFASPTRSLPLADGSIAVSWLDHFSEYGDKLAVVRVSPDGTTHAGPAFVELPAPSAQQSGPVLREGVLHFILGSNDWKDCAVGCPITFARFDAQTLALLETRELEWATANGQGILSTASCNADVCVSSVVHAPTGKQGLLWSEPKTGALVRHTTSDAPAILHSLGDSALALQERFPTDDVSPSWSLRLRFLTTDGSADLFAPIDLGACGAALGPMAWSGDSVVLVHRMPSNDKLQTVVRRFSSVDGLEIGEAVVVGDPGWTPSALVPFGSGFLLDGWAVPFSHQMRRLGADLRPLEEPHNAFDVSAYFYLEALSLPAPVLINSSYDGRSVNVAEVACR